MAGVNKVFIIGNLGKDPEVKYTPSGKCIANFSVATSETWKDKQTGEKKVKTEWHRIVCFDKLAENCGKCLRKGSKAHVEGKLETKKWQDQQGNDRWTTEIVASAVLFLDGLDGVIVQNGVNNPEIKPQQQTQTKQTPEQPAEQQQDFNDEDIPF